MSKRRKQKRGAYLTDDGKYPWCLVSDVVPFMRELGDVQSKDTRQKCRGELEGRKVRLKKSDVLSRILYTCETHKNDGYDCEDHYGSALFTGTFCLFNAGLFLFEIEQGM